MVFSLIISDILLATIAVIAMTQYKKKISMVVALSCCGEMYFFHIQYIYICICTGKILDENLLS